MDMVRRFMELELDENGKAIKLDVEEDKPLLKEIQAKSKNFKLFQGKKIFHEKEIMYKHFGKYPTINIDFGGVQADDFNGILSRLREAVNQAFGEHVYLKYNSWRRSRFNKKDFMKYFDCQKSQLLTLAEVEVGLKILAQILYEYHGKKVFVFIEEFDVPVNSMVYENKMSREDKEKSIKLLQMIYKNVLKGSEKFVARSLSNACQQLSGILSGSANNVRLCPFLQDDDLVEFIGFNKDEVKDLLERAGLSDHLNEVIAMYNGYNKKLKNGDVVEISSPWAIMQYIRTKEFNKYWSAGIPSEIESVIGDSKIRSKIKEMMSGKSVDIIYKGKLKMKDIHTLNKMICRTEIDEREVDLCLQFLYEMGFFSITFIKKDRLKLTVPNDSVRTAVNDILYDADFVKKYFDHSPVLINKFTDSAERVAIACMKRFKKTRNTDHTESDASIKQKVYELANDIKILFKSGKHRPGNEAELQSGLFHYLRQRFGDAAIERYTRDGKRCDIVISIGCFMFFIEVKIFKKTATDAHDQVISNRYYTLAEEESLMKVFPEKTPIVTDHIRMGLHSDREGEMSIAYSFKDSDTELVSTNDAKK
ncbi:hypothetical protein PV326_014219 [Microctonus aethiopoides]|nr:hypothetical protein PV326_014219 [Microctonus aethiopoides]